MRTSNSRRPIARVHSLLAALLSLALVAGSASIALAQDAGESEPKAKRKDKTYTLEITTMKKLAKFYEYSQEEDYDAALDVLISLARRKSLKKHDRATVYQYMGYMYAAKEDWSKAIKSMERSLEQDALPFSTTQLVKFNLGQLYMAEEKMDDAVRVLQDWYDQEESPTADQNFRLAVAYMATERYTEGLPYARKAVALSSEPKERYYMVNLNTEFQLGNFIESLELLKLLAMNFPKAQYFKQLAFGYTELGEMETALAVLQLAYSEGWLEKESDLIGLAQRLYSQELPYQAAQVIEKGMADGIIERTEKNLEFLSSALLTAREYEASLVPLAEAAALADNGDLYIRLAQVHLQVEKWGAAQDALELGIRKGGLKEPRRAQLLLGITHFNRKEYSSARTAFAQAALDENLEASAHQWIEHTDRQIRVREMEASQQAG